MRLKQLELHGYKSFATRTILEFTDGITSIVGPNGSGKSNITDAVRWVMGEQRFRSLRAKTTADMIFAGGPSRARLGMAEVLITLDNSDGWVPVDYTEVVIGRRAYRSGQNEYLLNGSRVRYRDLVQILGEARLMHSSYTVIGQGLVDAALSLRPEARRVLFEEAAGIAPHLRKRSRALKRVEETERNLQRVSDILHELHPLVESLGRQAERTEEDRSLTRRLRELQCIWYGYQWRRQQQRLDRTRELATQRAAQLEDQRSRARHLQQEQEQLRAQQEARQKTIDQLSATQADLRDQVEELRRHVAVSEERRRLFLQQRQSLETELGTLASRADILQGEINRVRVEIGEQEATQKTCQSELEVARAELARQAASLRAVQEQATATQTRLTQIVVTVSDTQARLEQLREQRATLADQREQGTATLVDLDQRLDSLRAEAEKWSEQGRALEETVNALRQSQTALEAEVAATQEQMGATQTRLAKLSSEREHLVARRESLTRLRQDLVGYYPGVREVLSSDAHLSGLLGTVANLMEVPREFEEAIQSALGSRLQNVVAERWEDAERAIDHLRSARAGWATFLPLDTVRSRPTLSLHSEPGVIGVGSRLVRFDERLRPVFDLLLGRTIIVRDLPTARRLVQRRLSVSLLVTLRGETVQPSGALSGGTRRQSTNLLAQEREWRSLPKRIQDIEDRIAEGERTLSAQETTLQDLRRRFAEQQRELSQQMAETDSAQAAGADCAQRQRGLERERQWQESRMAQAEATLKKLDEKEGPLRETLTNCEREQISLTESLGKLRAQLASPTDGGLRQKAAEMETSAAVALRTVRSQRTLLESHLHNLEELSGQIRDKDRQNVQLRNELDELQQTTETGKARLSQIEKEYADARQHLQPARADAARLDREMRNLERQRARHRQLLNKAELTLNSAKLERDRAQDRGASLLRRIENDLGPVELPEADCQQLRLDTKDGLVELPPGDSIPPNLEEDMRQIKARRRRLGSINPDAPQEYQQQLDRQAFLESQSDDLRAGISSLRKVIRELDTIIDQDFAATVNLVNEAFGAHFRTLFAGGSARLVLTDPANLSATGVDIIAHPPGKGARSLALLSGGERALTAVALVFALLRVNPVPFCFLDEVDAMLDESNVGRFRTLLEEHAKTTQFVLITHNRQTVECASSIYGISMDEQGVSQCVSLKLDAPEG